MSDTTSETEAGPSPKKGEGRTFGLPVPDNDSIMADELGILIGGGATTIRLWSLP